jgi:hypothetical protein
LEGSMIEKSRLAAIFAVCIFLALAMSACERKSINEILADPSHYAKREVVIAGNVVRSISLLGKGAYELDDGTGKLWVVSKTGVPRKGAQVAVKGTVIDIIDITAIVQLPEPAGSGLALREISHKAR